MKWYESNVGEALAVCLILLGIGGCTALEKVGDSKCECSCQRIERAKP